MPDIDSTPMNIYSLALLWVSGSFGTAVPLSILTSTNQLFNVCCGYLQTLWTIRIIHFHTFYTIQWLSMNNCKMCRILQEVAVCKDRHTHHSHWEYICFLQNYSKLHFKEWCGQQIPIVRIFWGFCVRMSHFSDFLSKLFCRVGNYTRYERALVWNWLSSRGPLAEDVLLTEQ